MTTKRRAPSSKSNGKVRQTLYRAAMGHVARSIREGFYLEAIALCESMISDRLESLTGAVDPETPNAGQLLALGRNLKRFKALLGEESEGVELAARIDNWREARNVALHEMVKLPEGDAGDWGVRRAGLAVVAREGRDLCRTLSGYVRRKRKAFREKALSEREAN